MIRISDIEAFIGTSLEKNTNFPISPVGSIYNATNLIVNTGVAVTADVDVAYVIEAIDIL